MQRLHANAGRPSNPVATACSVVTNGCKHDVRPQDDSKASPAEESSKTTTFLTLPGEIQNKILDELKFPDLCRFRATTKQCRGLVSELRLLNSIEQFENDYFLANPGISSSGWSGVRPTTPDGYTEEDFHHISLCMVCYGCRQIRPRHRFAFPLKKGGWESQVSWSLVGSDWISDLISQRSISQNVMVASEMEYTAECPLCWDCTLDHPQYLSSVARNQRWVGFRGHSLNCMPLHYGDDVGDQGARAVVCVSCRKLKQYGGGAACACKPADKNFVQIPEMRPWYVEARQIERGVCHECWYDDHGTWCDARRAIGEKVHEISCRLYELHLQESALKNEQSKLKGYQRWMLSVNEPHAPRGGLWEPKREFMLKDLPDWTEELSGSSVKMVQSQLASQGLIIPARFTSRGPRKTLG
jgi:hypothetical protein